MAAAEPLYPSGRWAAPHWTCPDAPPAARIRPTGPCIVRHRRGRRRPSCCSKLPCGTAVLKVNVPHPVRQVELERSAVFKLCGVLVGLVGNRAVVTSTFKHPHQDVQEMRELGEQRTAVRHGPAPRAWRVVALVPVPKAARTCRTSPNAPSSARFIHWPPGRTGSASPRRPSRPAPRPRLSTPTSRSAHGLSHHVLASPNRPTPTASRWACTPTPRPPRTEAGQQRCKGLVGRRRIDRGARRRVGICHRHELGVRPCLNHLHMALANVPTPHHRETYRTCHAAKVADYLRAMRVVSLVPSWTEFR